MKNCFNNIFSWICYNCNAFDFIECNKCFKRGHDAADCALNQSAASNPPPPAATAASAAAKAAEAAVAKAKWLEAEAAAAEAAAAEAAAKQIIGEEDGKKNLKIKFN